MRSKRGSTWSAQGVLDLRRSLRLSQSRLAQELGVRQQTISDWETGVYAPRGASVRLLDIVAEHAGFIYGEFTDSVDTVWTTGEEE
ncbi:MAG: helix-turn-helix protein [Chloroflexi bacterium]|nr:helix-turn-helix protein [Chloroflexota bacterium]